MPSQDILLAVFLTLLAVLVVYLVYVFMVSGGNVGRYWEAQAVVRRMLRDPDVEARVKEAVAPTPAVPPPPPKPSGEPLRLLTLLQREGRLLDFLLEDVSAATDDQLGAGVRQIHGDCQKALREHLVIEPVRPEDEGAMIEVPTGFDPSAVRLTGNVTGQPPFNGRLQHRGWRVREIRLQKPPEGQDEFVIQPAEVELT